MSRPTMRQAETSDERRETISGWPAAAIVATFARRDTVLQPTLLALTVEFASDAAKHAQWLAFLRRIKPLGLSAEFADVVTEIAGFLAPIAEALFAGKDFGGIWKPRGSWTA